MMVLNGFEWVQEVVFYGRPTNFYDEKRGETEVLYTFLYNVCTFMLKFIEKGLINF